MSDVTTKLIWQEGLAFRGLSRDGHEIILDGDRNNGHSPMEALIQAIGACSAIDVVVILDKQRTPAERLEVSLAGDRRENPPRYFIAIEMRFDLWGEGLQAEKVKRAISLSIEKYCSVFHTLRSDLKTAVLYRLHAPDAEAGGEYQTVEIEIPA